ncbi:MAG TPA: DUF3300 domain-containing protein [Bryobacteraceae bacterium]|jgi:hypothetical protein|nr:DUF3300 domain-containing protein [Bryobacteraceae bacterium]
MKKLLIFTGLIAGLALAQAPPPYPPPPPSSYPQQAPSYSPQELDNLVSRIALYPDPLLSQVLAAAGYPNEIPDAAAWANQHSYLHGDALAAAIQEDRLPWDPAVQALLPFPSVLNMMAGDMGWTTAIGNAFLADPNGVMDAVQRRRQEAMSYGYLQSNGQIVVTNSGGYVSIMPVNPAFIPVPVYNPGVVFVRPRPGFFVGGAITFGGVTLGAAFAPWGWGHNYFDWGQRRVIINDHPWERHWDNRGVYVHPYEHVERHPGERRIERHERHERR